MFHTFNKLIPTILEDMTVYERSELINLLLKQQDRRVHIGMRDYPVSAISLLTLQSDEGEEPGSHMADTVDAAASGDLEITVRYLDENPGTMVNFNPIADNTFYSDYVPGSDIQTFLNRPLKIASYSWVEGAHIAQALRPWDLYFNTTSVKKKLDNYQWLSCNLHVKVLLNASPFYYSAALVSYQPLPSFTPDTINSNFTTNSVGKLSGCSTRPHFWIYPQTNQGGEMTLPFLYYKNWLPINIRSGFQNMGILTISSATILEAASAAVGQNVTVSVFAWATDVRLSGPTINLALQSDEYDGPVSGMASNVAKVSRSLERIPMIGPFAKATTMISSGIASMAHLFGFTNVPIIEAVKPMKNLPYHSFASSEISQPIEKLSLDPKLELSIDNRIAGIGPDDEMIISNITQREALINVATWTSANVSGDIICKGNVLPYNINSMTVSTVPLIQGTPISHIASLFKCWRGDIIYRFRFICSRFHRGRVVIQWDPDGDIVTNNPDTNLVYSQVVDICEDTDVEFRIPYMQANPWQQTYLGGSNPSVARMGGINFANSGGSIAPYENYTMNGRITMRVLTQQTSPVDSSNIYVLTSIRSADNLEFANPTNAPQNCSVLNLQSHIIDLELQSDMSEYNSPDTYCVSDKPVVVEENRYLVNFGEQIRSLRQLLRRVSYSRSQTFGSDTTALVYLYSSTHAPQPLHKGYQANGINSAKGVVVPGTDYAYNYVKTTPYTWLSPCYIGYRGGFNWHYNVNTSVYVDHMRSMRVPVGQTVGEYSSAAILATGASSSVRAKFFQDEFYSGSSGQSLLNQKTQSGLSVYYPMYNRVRFFTTSPHDVVLGTTEDESITERCRIEAMVKPSYQTNTVVASGNIDFYSSIGTDFTFVFFLNVPSLYLYTSPTAT